MTFARCCCKRYQLLCQKCEKTVEGTYLWCKDFSILFETSNANIYSEAFLIILTSFSTTTTKNSSGLTNAIGVNELLNVVIIPCQRKKYRMAKKLHSSRFKYWHRNKFQYLRSSWNVSRGEIKDSELSKSGVDMRTKRLQLCKIQPRLSVR